MNNIRSLMVLVVALMASIWPVCAYAQTVVLVDGEVPLFTSKLAADMSATCNKAAFDEAVAKKAKCETDLASCSSEKAECEKVRDQCVKDAEEFDLLVDQALKGCDSPCKSAKDLRENPECFKPKPAAPATKSAAPKVKAAYCVNEDPVLDAVAGSGVVGKSDVVIVRSLSVDGSVAGVECVPSLAAVRKFVVYVRAEFDKVCYKKGAKELSPEDQAACNAEETDITWMEDYLHRLQNSKYPLTPERWVLTYENAAEANSRLGELGPAVDDLKRRVADLEKRADENDVKNEEQDNRLGKLERQPLGKTINLRLTLEAGLLTSDITNIPFVGPRMDLIVIPSLKSGIGGYFGLSGGRGWVQSVAGIEQPSVVTTGARTGFYLVLRPKPPASSETPAATPSAANPETGEQPKAEPPKVSKVAFGLHAGGVVLGAWPRESHQNFSTAGGEVGFDLFVDYFTLGLNMGVSSGSVARYEQDPARGGAVTRVVYPDTIAFSPGLNIGFNL